MTSIRLTDSLDLPPQWDRLTTQLDQIFSRVGLKDLSLEVSSTQTTPPSDDPSLLTEQEAFDLLGWYEGEQEIPPVIQSVALNVEPPPVLAATESLLVLQLEVLEEVTLELAGMDGVSIVLNPGGCEARWRSVGEEFTLETDLVVAIRFNPDLLRPLKKVIGSDGKVSFVEDETRAYSQIEVGSVHVALDSVTGLDVSAQAGIRLTAPAMIGDTGVVVEEADIELNLSGNGARPAGTPTGWKGVLINHASVRIPDVVPGAFFADGFGIGSGGVSGEIGVIFQLAYANGTFTGEMIGEIFGLQGGVEEISLSLQQNIPAGGGIRVQTVLPFFEADHPVGIEIGWTAGKGFVAAARNLGTLTKAGVMSIVVQEIRLVVQGGLATIQLSGKLTPLFGAPGLKWPAFDVKDLSIDSKGNVKLPGGWLSLAQQKTFDFHGFKIEISQIGFGKTDDGGKWVGFSGSLKLVDKLQAGGSVEGLRITWYPDGRKTKISLNGAGVELKIPGVLQLKGEISYREMILNGEEIKRFDGDIKLILETPEMKIDGALVIGSAKGPQGRYNFMAIYADVELPTGIPLANTGLAIYGFAGLFALQMEPNKKAEEAWFSIDHGKSFYHRGKPGITDLKTKWDPKKGSFAVGAGITLGTLADNGYTFSGKFLLAIVIPGPIVLLQGASSFLTNEEGEGQFRSLAVYDGRAGSVLIGLDAAYKTGEGGEMIEIGGSMEAFYSFHDPRAWHLWLGKNEPRELRIRALFGRFVEANAFFMLDAHQLALGAWFGYARGWNFGPLSIRLEAWAEGNALISFRPTHFHGDLWLHALIELNAFGFGFGLSLDARIAADLFRPFHLRGEFRVGVKLPWPFKKKSVGATVVLEWGPRPDAPPLPLPLHQVAVEHLKSTVVYPLPRGKHLLPVWADGNGFLTAKSGADEPDLATLPIVPLDGRISLTFGRSVHDEAAIGGVVQPVVPEYEDIGHPGKPPVARAKYLLEQVQLSRRDETSGAWITVAQSPKAPSLPALFGSWMPVPALPDSSSNNLGQTKLLVWSKSAYDFTRNTGTSWAEWVSDTLPDYPCLPSLPAQELCFGFSDLAVGTQLKSPWTHEGDPRVTLSWGFGPATVNSRPFLISRSGGTFDDDTGGFPLPSIHTLCFSAETLAHDLHIRPEVPARSVRLVLAPRGGVLVARAIFSSGSASADPVCVDVRQQVAGTVANPWTHDRVRFVVHDAIGALLPQGRIERWSGGSLGLNAGHRLDVELPCASPWVDLIVTHRPPFRIVAFNGHGVAVATHAPVDPGAQVTETIRLEGDGITRVEIHAGGNEKLVHSVCYLCPPRPGGMTVTGFDAEGNQYGPFVPDGNTVVVQGDGITDVVVSGDTGTCIEQICITPDPEAGQVLGHSEMIEHIREELERWQTEGAVLQPHSTYRLTVHTSIEPVPTMPGISFSGTMTPYEHAYFRTEGPPGITRLLPPEGVPPDQFDSGLDDLVRYVRATDPSTVPRPGEKPILFEPFYRAYDVGVEFNENYVEQMYRMDGRDLGLYLFDNSNQPARDAHGRLLVVGDQWSRGAVTVTETDKRWITQLNSATCLPEKLDPESFPRASVLVSRVPERVLPPDTLHEARLIPLLLHETFARAPLADVPPGWVAADSGSGGSSKWMVGEAGEPASRFVEQLSAIGDATPERNGTLLLLTAGSEWTDYRVSAFVRSSILGAVGVAIRASATGGYRFFLDAGMRRLVKVANGVVTTLAGDHFAYRKDREYRLSVEANGSVLRAFVDGEPVFEVTDTTFDKGSIALYTAQSAGARFSDVVVDDLRRDAPVVYRFSLTTSLYANFHHHMHSFQDELWAHDLGSAAVSAALAEAVPPQTFTTPGEKEARAYEEVATAILGQAARQNPERVEITRVTRDNAPPCYLLRSPEPLDPKRVAFALARSTRELFPGAPPAHLKLTEASLGAIRPQDESVTLLVRDGGDLTRRRIELRELPGPVAELTGDPLLWSDTFRDASSLARFTIVDSPDAGGVSAWLWEHEGLVETSGIGGGTEPELPGTHALTGEAGWNDFHLFAELRADAEGELGVVFRYVDEQNHYRFSLGAALAYRRLVKVVAGVTTMLWEESDGYAAGQPFRLDVEAAGTRLRGFVDGALAFEVRDEAHAAGRTGLYAASNPGARCERFEVRLPSLERRALFADRFTEGNLDDWTFVSEMSVPIEQAAQWTALPFFGLLSIGTLVTEGGDPELPGVLALTGDAAWTDAVIQGHLGINSGAAGLVLRATDAGDYYRFSMTPSGRLLVKKSGVAVTVLWRDASPYDPSHGNQVTFSAIGDVLRVHVDAVPVLSVRDADLTAGRAGLHAWNDSVATFSGVHVWPGSQEFTNWTLEERFAALDPGHWTFVDGNGIPEADQWLVEDGWLRRPDVQVVPGDEPVPIDFEPSTLRAAPFPNVVRRFAVSSGPEVAELRLSARVVPATDVEAGIVFGWRDPANHLALRLTTGSADLVRTEATSPELLATQPVTLEVGREYVVSIEHFNGRLSAFLDGMPLFAVDAPDVSGRIGFSVLAKSGELASARFGELRVAVPEWSCWHAFGDEERLPAGTRLRLSLAPSLDPFFPGFNSDAGLVKRTLALPTERGRTRLRAEGATLRIVEPEGTGHVRSFLPEDSWLPAAMHVIRKADGTGCVLIPDPQLASGSLRVELMYMRDRNEAGRPMSQAGDLRPERVTLMLH